MGDVIEILTTATNTVEVEAQGPQGIPGVGVPTGGSALQVLRKKTSTDYDTEWAAAGSGSGSVTSVALASTDLTISGSPITDSGTITANIAANAVTLNKLETIQSAHFLGRHGSGAGDVQPVSASQARTILNVADGAEVNVNADWNASSGDAQILNKPTIPSPSSATPQALGVAAAGTASAYAREDHVHSMPSASDVGAAETNHASQHEYGGSDAVDLVATSLLLGDGNPDPDFFGTQVLYYTSEEGAPANWNVTAPDDFRSALELGTAATADIGTGSTEVAAGDHGHGNITTDGKIGSTSGLPLVTTTAGAVTTLALGTANQVLRVNSGATGVEFADPAASGVTGAAASASDVLGVSGANITGVDANADRIVYWNNTSNKLAYGTPADAGAAAASHTHTSADINSQTANNGHVLTANGSGGASFAALPASGISAVGASTADVLSVSGSDLVADDGGTIDSSDPFIKWDDAAGKLVYANPLSRPSGAFYVGLAPTTTAIGTRAINIQSGRAAAANVAANTDSIAIGNNARTAGTESVAIGLNARSGGQGSVVIGWGADSSSQATSVGWGSYAHGGGCAFGQGASGHGDGGIAMGQSAASSSYRAMVVGYAASASGQESVALGSSANASAQNAVALGTSQSANLRSGVFTRPIRAVFWGGETTNNTATVLNLDATATNRFTIAANTALAVDILLVARRSDVADKWLVARRFLGIRRDGSNNTSLIGTVQTLGTDQSAGSPTWTFSLTADDTNEALQLEVTGETSETVQWRATALYRVA